VYTSPSVPCRSSHVIPESGASSDSTGWHVDDESTVREEFEAYRDAVAPEASLYLVDLAAYGDLVTPEGYEDVYNVSGWSENVLEFIQHAEEPMQVIDDVEAFEPV
jgi:hypothetical protein